MADFIQLNFGERGKNPIWCRTRVANLVGLVPPHDPRAGNRPLALLLSKSVNDFPVLVHIDSPVCHLLLPQRVAEGKSMALNKPEVVESAY